MVFYILSTVVVVVFLVMTVLLISLTPPENVPVEHIPPDENLKEGQKVLVKESFKYPTARLGYIYSVSNGLYSVEYESAWLESESVLRPSYLYTNDILTRDEFITLD
jgi:hypothetical protein